MVSVEPGPFVPWGTATSPNPATGPTPVKGLDKDEGPFLKYTAKRKAMKVARRQRKISGGRSSHSDIEIDIKDCKRIRESGGKPSCCDCGQEHAANYRRYSEVPKPKLLAPNKKNRSNLPKDRTVGALTNHISTEFENSSWVVPANSDRKELPRDVSKLIRVKNAALRRAEKHSTCENRCRGTPILNDLDGHQSGAPPASPGVHFEVSVSLHMTSYAEVPVYKAPIGQLRADSISMPDWLRLDQDVRALAICLIRVQINKCAPRLRHSCDTNLESN
ncbi:hypothetical protein EVAR_71158_1 [Eumeta japonica]|uniref:Uncharacterized protein n=1 Tax=Eumeta variegata TaxID=151549 RepID=A0A4C1T1Z9_EUMVA|nr:hypothetical protein EVAR_71158_1 [Eumeta japonica]